jgi:hypothetical protein
MIAYKVVNLLGQSRLTAAPAPDPLSPAGRQHLPCPPVRTDDPTLNCVQTRDGGVLCSDGAYFPPGCPMPKYSEGEYATYKASQGFLFPVPPKASSLTAQVGSSFPIIPLLVALTGYVISIVADI